MTTYAISGGVSADLTKAGFENTLFDGEHRSFLGVGGSIDLGRFSTGLYTGKSKSELYFVETGEMIANETTRFTYAEASFDALRHNASVTTALAPSLRYSWKNNTYHSTENDSPETHKESEQALGLGITARLWFTDTPQEQFICFPASVALTFGAEHSLTDNLPPQLYGGFRVNIGMGIQN